MSRLLGDLVKGIVASADEAAVVAELDNETGLESAVESTRANFVIAALDEHALSEPYLSLFEHRPLVKVLAIAGDGDTGSLWELRPDRVALGEVCPASLLTALRMPGWRNDGT
jgi:hypothetical protein